MRYLLKRYREWRGPGDLKKLFLAERPGEPAPVLLHDAPDLLLTATPGESRDVSIVFVGVGFGVGGIQAPELQGSASGRGRRHLIYVVDKKRIWYNGEGMLDTIARIVADYVAAQKIEDSIAIGNSMGGHGALMLAAMLSCRRAIAFAPQYSLDLRQTPGEKGYGRHRRMVDKYRTGRLSDHYGEGPDYLIFSGLSDAEMAQINAFEQPPNGGHWLFPGHRHGLAQYFKRAGLLEGVVRAAMDGGPAEMAAALDDQPTFARLSGRWAPKDAAPQSPASL